MEGIRKGLGYYLLLPNGRYYGSKSDRISEFIVSGTFDPEQLFFDSTNISLPTVGKIKRGSGNTGLAFWHEPDDKNLDFNKVLNRFEKKLRTKSIETFSLRKEEVGLLLDLRKDLAKQEADRTKQFEEMISFISNGEEIELALNIKTGDESVLAKTSSVLGANATSVFSFDMSLHLVRFLKKDDTFVRVGKNGWITFTPHNHDEEVHFKSKNLST